ncbi:2-hydroxyacyl-CoA dehydratase [Amphibacillus jilinensis]|uniref:2-hydroxyacyl-CoA dehydratase n=1 Tax=Amphibacillus jilinensis TaxID=1216008 RepID=UPI0003147259|nr:2-hydroxyacyl-CoA dehydratase [Amphibacillus jilinensis]
MNQQRPLLVGIDIGSTTIKIVVLDQDQHLLYKTYQRHYSDIKLAVYRLFQELIDTFDDQPIKLKIAGSGGIGLADTLNITFIQEVIACSKAVETLIPETEIAIELGGEDAKITFFDYNLDQRMNGTCAGGTGAFIDQMASLLNTDVNGLNELAKTHKKIYPIASRCGVFAKTDIQPLINDGVAKEDIAASIFQAVVNQTITGLAAGRKLQGKIAFLGGPLCFMSELRQRFIETLELKNDDVIFPSDSQYFVAIGAALDATSCQSTDFITLKQALETEQAKQLTPLQTLDPLFENEEALQQFRERHQKATVSESDLDQYQGVCFLGIDAGSTTTKAILIDKDGDVLWKFYGSNEGDPLQKTMAILKQLYQAMPANTYIGRTVVTGYGEALIKNALHVDQGEVETVCHYKAANRFQPGVDFILDIGGQDMKAMTIKNGTLASIQLNEACSSGCGSFIETFAQTLKHDVKAFAQKALLADHPVDLGSRCTVFMNSKVKQTQKEGATVENISAGLAISVIKNALHKVIKVRNPQELGAKIVCQGGTFNNEAVLRAFEIMTKREVIRPNLAGLMGAYGAGLIAKENYKDGQTSKVLTIDAIDTFSTKKKFAQCRLCENNCALTIIFFPDGRRFVTGNRCEKGAKAQYNQKQATETPINLIDYKLKRLFGYTPLDKPDAPRGTIGIPRVLNLYDHYPLWFTFFTKLGFQVRLSPPSTKKIYHSGIDTIPDDSVCFPAKMVHGHIQYLIDHKVDMIFYPAINLEMPEQETADNSYNCPVVTSYPTVIKNNSDPIMANRVDFRAPHLNLSKPTHVIDTLYLSLKDKGLTKKEVKLAYQAGQEELNKYRHDLQKQGEQALITVQSRQEQAIVLAGRPYHADPKINHSIANMMTQEGFHVLTEDSICHLEEVKGLRVVNQWTYYARLFAAAKVVCKFPTLEMVQLNSFGCGIDAITTDQVQEILEQDSKINTVLKIDEGSNLGAARIRIRSLKAAMHERRDSTTSIERDQALPSKVTFTKSMKKNHTLLLPLLSPIHQEGLFDEALRASGYHVVQLTEDTGRAGIEEGLKYVHNDACYPAIITIGQLVKALKSGAYDVDHTSVMMTQSGGGCRATNYIPLLRKALTDAGFPQVPVVSLSFGNKGTEKNQGFKLTLPLIKRVFLAVLYGDLLQKLVNRTRPYEIEHGSVNRLYDKWSAKAKVTVQRGHLASFTKQVQDIITDFDTLSISNQRKPIVGLTGEILVKHSTVANHDLVCSLEAEGVEAVLPDLLGFMNYNLLTMKWKAEHLGFNGSNKYTAQFALKLIERLTKPINQALQQSQRFTPFHSIEEIARDVEGIISLGNHTGEGWYMTGEIVQFLKAGINNVIIMQPFGCLPNHIVGRGMMKAIRSHYPKANMTAIDYDPGISTVNQLNRIRLMLASAFKSHSDN